MNKKTIARVLVIAGILGLIIFLEVSKGNEKSIEGGAINIVPRGDETIVEMVGGEMIKKESLDIERSIDKSKKYDVAKEITTPDGFINIPTASPHDPQAISIQGLIGKKVILVDFWTYTCINCQRTIPYLNTWYEKYKDEGLEIIGVHTPEFEFEKKFENVNKAVSDAKIKYPVVLDNDFSTWKAYGNNYWPRKYIIDIDGYIVYDHIGEGGYEQTEKKIQELLRERKVVLSEKGEVTATIKKEDLNALSRASSPEVYFGAKRNEYLASENVGKVGGWNFTKPDTNVLKADQLYLGGYWNINDEYAENTNGSATIIFKYRAKSVYFVASSEKSIRAKVLIDGKPIPASLRGEDVGTDGSVLIKADRLYKLVNDSVVGEHTLELQIENASLKAFTFTFG